MKPIDSRQTRRDRSSQPMPARRHAAGEESLMTGHQQVMRSEVRTKPTDRPVKVMPSDKHVIRLSAVDRRNAKSRPSAEIARNKADHQFTQVQRSRRDKYFARSSDSETEVDETSVSRHRQNRRNKDDFNRAEVRIVPRMRQKRRDSSKENYISADEKLNYRRYGGDADLSNDRRHRRNDRRHRRHSSSSDDSKSRCVSHHKSAGHMKPEKFNGVSE